MGGIQEDEKESRSPYSSPCWTVRWAPAELIQAEISKAIPEDGDKCPQKSLALKRNQGNVNVPTVIRKDTGRMNVPNGPGTSKRPLKPEAETRLSKEHISPTTGEPASGMKNIVTLEGLEGYEGD
jgi:hypothetical protein